MAAVEPRGRTGYGAEEGTSYGLLRAPAHWSAKAVAAVQGASLSLPCMRYYSF
jgi:hypothetical protein